MNIILLQKITLRIISSMNLKVKYNQNYESWTTDIVGGAN
jgi:hypothetical protein